MVEETAAAGTEVAAAVEEEMGVAFAAVAVSAGGASFAEQSTGTGGAAEPVAPAVLESLPTDSVGSDDVVAGNGGTVPVGPEWGSGKVAGSSPEVVLVLAVVGLVLLPA